MSLRTTYILFGILLVVLAAFGLTQYFGVRKPSERQPWVFPSLHDKKKPVNAEDIEVVEIERTAPRAEKLFFYRTEDGWKLTQPKVRVDGFAVDGVVQQVTEARKEAGNLSSNLAEYGLDNPNTVVTLRKKGGPGEWKLNVGKESVTGGATSKVVYVTSSENPHEAVAVRRGGIEHVFKGLNDFRNKALLTASTPNVQYLELQRAGAKPVVLEKTSDNRWRFQAPPFGDAEAEGARTPAAPTEPKQLDSVRELADALTALKVGGNEDFVAEDVPDAELAKYGLEAKAPATLRVVVKRTGNLLGGADDKKPVEEVLLIGKKVEPPKADKKDDKTDKKNDKKDKKAEEKEKKPEDKAEYYYARLESENQVVRLPIRNVEPILEVAAKPEVLRNRDLVQADSFRVDAIDVKNTDGPFKLRKSGPREDWKLYAGAAKPRDGDDRAVGDLLSALTAKRLIESFPDKSDADLGLSDPKAPEVSLWVDGVQKDEPKDDKKDEKAEAKKADEKKPNVEPKLKSDKPTVRLVFGKKDNKVVYVLRETKDEKVRVAVPESLLARVTAGPLTYLDRLLPSFPSEQAVTKLTLTRGGETHEMERDEKTPAVWKIKQPKDLAGRNADAQTIDRILNDLRLLQNEKYVAEKPSDSALVQYGLKPPAYQAAVTVKGADGKPEDHTYLFGKETEDKGGVYAKLASSDLVFVTRPQTLVALQGELLDPTVFQFDPAKVKQVKVQGWEKLYKFEVALDLVKSPDGKVWSAKMSPPGFKLDEQKVDAFVKDLATLKADRILVRKAGPKPEHKLAKNERALEIELTLEGEKAPYTLTIGELDKEKKGYYAQSGGLPGDVFLVPAARFQKLLEDGAKYFSP